MNREQITRDDFPAAGDGYDRLSVDAHLAAVAAWTTALEAQITSLEVERNALRRRPEDARQTESEVDAGRTAEPDAPSPVGAEPSGLQPVPTRPERAVDPVVRPDDEVSARLVATRLALEGSERDEIVGRLTDSYELEDPAALVEDVLARLA